MSSQRARENRIAEKLTSGTLRPAPPDTPEAVRASISKPGGENRCRGCDELQADSLVGDRPWHYLCFLYWQGRSETVRANDLSGIGGEQGLVPERSRWVIVVQADRPDRYAALRRNFAGSRWVDVVVDRRGAQPAQGGGSAPETERRRSAFRQARRGTDFEVYEATAPLAGRCPQCNETLSVELPRFAEPPVRLELSVVHENVPPDRARHAVELQSLSATGRVLLASRLFARTQA